MITAAVSAVALGSVLAGCGSKSAPAPAASITRVQAARRYQADVAVGNAVANTLSEELTSSTSGAELQHDGAPFVRVIRRLNPKLTALARAYPPAAVGLKAEVTADHALIQDFVRGSETSLSQDIQSNQSAVDFVRSALGLARR